MQRSLRAARVATYVYFVLNGTLMGAWVVSIPAVETRVGISHAALGGLLVLLGLGAFLGMQVAGRLADRLGTRTVVPAAGVLCGAALVLPGLPHDPWTLAGALLVFGFANGSLDVSMNAHAVHVEKAYGRPVMSGFHATFSVGGVVAALVAAGASGVGLRTAATLGGLGAAGIVIALGAARFLLHGVAVTVGTGSEEKGSAGGPASGAGGLASGASGAADEGGLADGAGTLAKGASGLAGGVGTLTKGASSADGAGSHAKGTSGANRLAETKGASGADGLADGAGGGGSSAGARGGGGDDARRRIRLLAVLALMVMLCEGAANDWSALHLKDVLGAPASTAAFAYGTYAAAMTAGRLLADRIVARFGPAAVLRWGATTAAVGITVVAAAPWVWAAFAGWALFGLGLSGCVPQLFSAAGHTDPAAAGANVSRVAGVGYLGMLAGPAVIGWLTHIVALNHAFLLLTVLCAATATAAGILRAAPKDDGAAAGDPDPVSGGIGHAESDRTATDRTGPDAVSATAAGNR